MAVTYVKHENTQELELMLRGGMAVPGKVLELILTWQYYIFCCPFYFVHQLILSVFIYHDIMMPYDFYYYLSSIRTVIGHTTIKRLLEKESKLRFQSEPQHKRRILRKR